MSSIDDILSLGQREIFRQEDPSVLKRWVNQIDSAMEDLPTQRKFIITQLEELNRRSDIERISHMRGKIDTFKEQDTSE